MSDSIISVQNLNKTYNKGGKEGHAALKDLSLEVCRGKIFGLLGPNGAGKSTLINILAGVVIKDSGEVHINDISIDKYPKKARSQIGIVPQEINIDSFFSLYEGLEYYAGYYGVRPSERKTERILKDLHLWDKRDVRPIKLSGGMKRRFLIAKAMVHSPKILVLDEPTAGVDLELRNQLWELIRRLQKEGTTIILTTHYLAEAQELCDDIAFINHGRIIKQSSKEELLNDLGNRYMDIHLLEPYNKPNKETKAYDQITDLHLRFTIVENQDYQKILEVIKSEKLQVKNIEIVQPNLEDIFYKVMHQ